MPVTLASLVVASFYAAVSLPVVPVSPERIQILLKKLEAPAYAERLPNGEVRWRYYFDAKEGPEVAFGPAMVEPLIAFANDDTKAIDSRKEAIWNLSYRITGYFREPDERVVKAMAGLLEDKDPAIRCKVANTIYFCGLYRCRTALPFLPDYRRSLSPKAIPEFAAGLASMVGDPDSQVCIAGCQALYATDLVGVGVPGLLSAAKRDDPKVRIEAMRALGETGRDHPESLKVMLKQLDPKNDKGAYVCAVYTIGQFGPRAKDAIPELKRIVQNVQIKKNAQKNEREAQDYSVDLVFSAIRSLGSIGPEARSALPAILERVSEPRFAVLDLDGPIRLAVMRIDAEAGSRLEREHQRRQGEWEERLRRNAEH